MDQSMENPTYADSQTMELHLMNQNQAGTSSPKVE